MPTLSIPALCLATCLVTVPTGSVPKTRVADEPDRALIGARSGQDRDVALKKHGGNSKTEAAVVAGLDWLARHQNEDGSFSADGFPAQCDDDGNPCDGIGKGHHGESVPCPFNGAISALATLAFLGHGHHPGAEGDSYAESVARSLEYLERSPDGTWTRPWALAAFAEAEVLGGTGRYLDAVESRARALLNGRLEDGGFGYGASRGSDVPYTALAIQGLVAAADAGVQLPADLGTGVDTFLNSLESGKGRLGYILNGKKAGYTPTATNAHLAAAIRELLTVNTSGSRHKSHLSVVRKQRPKWDISFKTMKVKGHGVIEVQIGHLSMYQWWYGTIASFHHGRSTWSSWFSATKKTLLANQQSQGCERGSWNPDGTYERQSGGRVMSTALGVLMLEQPYRHLRQD